MLGLNIGELGACLEIRQSKPADILFQIKNDELSTVLPNHPADKGGFPLIELQTIIKSIRHFRAEIGLFQSF